MSDDTPILPLPADLASEVMNLMDAPGVDDATLWDMDRLAERIYAQGYADAYQRAYRAGMIANRRAAEQYRADSLLAPLNVPSGDAPPQEPALTQIGEEGSWRPSPSPR